MCLLQAGSTLRIVIASRDRLGNDRRGKEFLEDADLFQIRIRRTDSYKSKSLTLVWYLCMIKMEWTLANTMAY